MLDLVPHDLMSCEMQVKSINLSENHFSTQISAALTPAPGAMLGLNQSKCRVE